MAVGRKAARSRFSTLKSRNERQNVTTTAAIANGTDFGLAAALWTRDLSRAHSLAKRLQAGIIWINCTNVFGPWMPYGGYKLSGLGFECGIEGLKEFSHIKTVLIDTSDQVERWALD